MSVCNELGEIVLQIKADYSLEWIVNSSNDQRHYLVSYLPDSVENVDKIEAFVVTSTSDRITATVSVFGYSSYKVQMKCTY